MSTIQVLPLAHDERHKVDVMVGAKVRGRMAEKKVTQTDIALALGLRQQSVSKRLNGRVPFEYGELWLIARCLGIESVHAMLAEVDSPRGGGAGAGNFAGKRAANAARALARLASHIPAPATLAA